MIWPSERRCAVSFTFDVDGETVPHFIDPKYADRRVSLMSEYAYGPRVGVPRILDLLDVYEFKATFFVPGWIAELHQDLIREISTRGHEIGHHGYVQERPYMLSKRQEVAALQRATEAIEHATGTAPNAYRSSAWEFSPSSPATLVEHGFRYDSSLMGDDYPYWVTAGNERLLELPVHWRNDDWVQFGYASVPPTGLGISAPSKALELFSEEFEGSYERGALFVMTMHPFLTGRPSGLRLLERLIRHIRGFPRVWWATLADVADHCYSLDIAETLDTQPPVIPAPTWEIPQEDGVG